MTRSLVALFALLECADYATYLLAPHLEANPAMAALSPLAVGIAKAAGVALALVIVTRITTPELQALALGIGIGVAAFGLGANIATLSAAPRPAVQPAPIGDEPTGIEQGSKTDPAAGPRTAVPRRTLPAAIGTGPARLAEAGDPNPSPVLRGRASWVRASLGSRYLAARLPKGTVLRICGALGCVTGVVMDYGPSKRLHPDRIVDLSRVDFARICGDPILLGTCRVRVRVVNVVPPETDTP